MRRERCKNNLGERTIHNLIYNYNVYKSITATIIILNSTVKLRTKHHSWGARPFYMYRITYFCTMVSMVLCMNSTSVGSKVLDRSLSPTASSMYSEPVMAASRVGICADFRDDSIILWSFSSTPPSYNPMRMLDYRGAQVIFEGVRWSLMASGDLWEGRVTFDGVRWPLRGSVTSV